MITEIHGILVAVGTPPALIEPAQPRALVHCTEQQIRDIPHLPMMRPVVIITESELADLRADKRRIDALLTLAGGACAFPAFFDLRAELRRGREGFDQFLGLNPDLTHA
jgi:hypothetical protein